MVGELGNNVVFQTTLRVEIRLLLVDTTTIKNQQVADYCGQGYRSSNRSHGKTREAETTKTSLSKREGR